MRSSMLQIPQCLFDALWVAVCLTQTLWDTHSPAQISSQHPQQPSQACMLLSASHLRKVAELLLRLCQT